MLKIISFNIKCGGSGEHAIPVRAPLLKTILDQYDADLVGLQEATPDWMECIERDYGEEYAILNQYRAKDSLESTPLLFRKSRFECLDHGHFWLSETPSIESGVWDNYGYNRICVWAKLFDKQEGTTVAFFNTHYGFGDENQLKSGNLILKYIEAMKADACFLTADFNMYPHSPGYKLLTDHLVDVNMATVQDTRFTYHGYKPEGRTHGAIDFCFVTPNVTPITYKRLDDTVNGQLPSDHYGIYNEVQVHKSLKFYSQRVFQGAEPDVTNVWFLRKMVGGLRADIIALQQATYIFERRFSRADNYTGIVREDTEDPARLAPLFWREDLFDVAEQETLTLGDSIANLAVLQYKVGGKKICAVSAHFGEEKEAFAKLIVEKLAAYQEMLILLGADLDAPIGSPAYLILKEALKDLRVVVNSRDMTPTYHGFFKENTAPAITDFVFTNGEGASKLTYKVQDQRPRKRIFSDHDGIFVTCVLD